MKNLKEKLLIFEDGKINLKKTIYILLLILVFSGIFGFIYETIFYRIDLGHFVKRGDTFGPWVPIYAYGGILVTIFSYRFRKNPLIVFIINCIVTGLLEYGTGYVAYEFFGKRFWDYNTEIWNFGNINGYICLRSILFFGISSLLLVYLIIPFFKKFAVKVSEKNLGIISISLGLLFFLDVILFAIIK